MQVITPQLADGDELIIVDSSDPELLSKSLTTAPKVKYLTTEIRSAAVQRNIGLDHLGISRYTFFLDDDTIPNKNYFEKCISILDESNAIGVSGIALNPKSGVLRSYPKGMIGAYYRFFLLDSMKDGVLLKSGVNIPVRKYLGDSYQVDWLIGCSGWLTEKIGDTRFESDFLGQSLSEDVIFSVRMRKKGLIVTDPSIILTHDESEIARPSKDEFWKMWMINRYRLIGVASFGIAGALCYWWANLGQLGILCYSKFRKQNYSSGSIKGLLTGALVILGMKN